MEKVGLIFGGIGNESEISILSAKNIAKHFDMKKYELILIHWNKEGGFYKVDNIEEKLNSGRRIPIENLKDEIDIAFPITHGRYGEDGILQSILEVLKIKYCGCRVASSSLCMDKGIFKTFIEGKFNQVNFISIDHNNESDEEVEKKLHKVRSEFSLPVFVKPANSGSSVGISKITEISFLDGAIKEALKHDHKVVIEEGLTEYKEIELAVIGNKKLTISPPGELKGDKEFYDFEEKYINCNTKVIIPADLSNELIDKIKVTAARIYRYCGCSGFARVDLFLKDDEVLINEINTLPGFTDISMFPTLLLHSGLSYKEIINQIIELAS